MPMSNVDTRGVEIRLVECLACGQQRLVGAESGECPRCRYLGWAPAEEVTESLRRGLRDVPVVARRLVAVERHVVSFDHLRRRQSL
jgi:tRNA(Ile2) C34 agmatinyltransferase TiaS